MQVLRTRETPVQSFYFNLQELESYWGQSRAYHHTAPISMTYALREALRMMMEEGIETRIDRHARVAGALCAGLEALGLELLADPEHRLNPLTTVAIPDGIDDAQVRSTLLNDYGIEIGGGLGEFRGKAWRIGLMGDSARDRNVLALLSALEQFLTSVTRLLRLELLRPKGPRASTGHLASRASSSHLRGADPRLRSWPGDPSARVGVVLLRRPRPGCPPRGRSHVRAPPWPALLQL